MSNTIKVEVGQIYEVVTDNFYGSKDVTDMPRPAKFHIEKGEKIEIRFPFAWHYRTIDNMYLQSDEEYLLDNCKIYGIIDSRIRFENRASLEEILRLKLFTPCQ